MAKFINGANGTFSGKVGSVIGSSWRGISYLRGLGKKSNKPATELQLAQRQRFSLVTAFMAPLLGIVNIGFRNIRKFTASPYSMAVKANLDNAVTGVMPNFTFDFPLVIFSSGNLYGPISNDVQVAAGEITINWNAALNYFSGASSDEGIILVYNVERDVFLTTDAPVVRADATAQVTVPPEFAGDTGHAWMFFASVEGRAVSNTIYLGAVAFV